MAAHGICRSRPKRVHKLHIKNFKSLRDVRIPLSPRLTVFVGPNNSGKSNALAALELLGETQRRAALNRAVSALPSAKSVLARGQTTLEIVARGSFNNGDLTYILSATGNNGQLDSGEERVVGSDISLGSDPHNPRGQVKMPNGATAPLIPGALLSQYVNLVASPRSDLYELWEELRSIQVFDLSVAKLRQPSKYSKGMTLQRDGTGIAAVLDAMQGERPDLFDQIEREVCAAASEVRRLRTPYAEDQEELKVVGVQENSGQMYPG